MEAEYSATFASDPLGWKRSLSLAERATDQSITLEFLIPLISVWISSQYPRIDLTGFWNADTSDAGFEAANYTILRDTIYPNGWSGTPEYAVDEVIVEELCNMAVAANGLENLAAATSIMCLSPDDDTGVWYTTSTTKRGIEARRLSVLVITDRTSDGTEPSVSYAMNGVINVSFEYWTSI